jgi:D-alanyl-lipoteichoic acid acyltransferase DltB (MBOAT superfamily)
METARSDDGRSLKECLFFLLVNPAIVFCDRGERVGDPRVDWRGGLRVLLGVLAMFLSSAILRPAARAASSGALALGSRPDDVRALACFGVLIFLGEYASHSGLASIQLGLLRQAGYRAPERYRYPFLATDPIDFWRRWNVYVGTWLRLYVFTPAARAALRRRGKFVLPVPWMMTIAASGALHDGYAYLASGALNLRFSGFFACVFAAIVLWRASGAVIAWVEKRSSGRHWWVSTGTTVVSRLCLATGVVAAAIAWG